MIVLHWGTFDLGKPRTRILRAGLVAAGASLQDCHTPIWTGREDKTQQTGALQRLWTLLRWLASYPLLVWRFLRAPRPDVVLTSFPGVLDTIVLAPFARLRGVPLVCDLFISAYDSLVFDRRLVREGSLVARALRWVEGWAIRSADLALLDTATHARRVEALFDLPPGSCGAVPVGAESEYFKPAPIPEGRAPGDLQVLFYGQFIPLHGIETILRAAQLVRDEPIEWTLIGRGQEAASVRRLLAADPLPRVRWVDWVEYGELGEWIGQADLCLGIFGTSEKAASVIPNKVYQTLACGRPLVTRDSPAIRELLDQAPPCVYLVPPADPDALADAIRQHARTIGFRKHDVCHAGVTALITAPAIGACFLEVLSRRFPLVH